MVLGCLDLCNRLFLKLLAILLFIGDHQGIGARWYPENTQGWRNCQLDSKISRARFRRVSSRELFQDLWCHKLNKLIFFDFRQVDKEIDNLFHLNFSNIQWIVVTILVYSVMSERWLLRVYPGDFGFFSKIFNNNKRIFAVQPVPRPTVSSLYVEFLPKKLFFFVIHPIHLKTTSSSSV